MCIGHFAVGFAAKKLTPKISLGTLFLSVQLVDLLWPAFLILGWERVRIDPRNTVATPLDFYDYPVTHSLVGTACWALILGTAYYLFRHYLRGALVLGAGVLSHWVLDAIVHRPDLPILPRIGPYVGLGLWNSLIGTVTVELGLFVLGVALYTHVSGLSRSTLHTCTKSTTYSGLFRRVFGPCSEGSLSGSFTDPQLPGNLGPRTPLQA
jgi:membrane-bound metal-dependent hydrolase YbcI (DUF457 family)